MAELVYQFGLKYGSSSVGLSAAIDNTIHPFVVQKLKSYKLVDELNKLKYVTFTMSKRDVEVKDIYLERNAYISEYDFYGIITGIEDIDDLNFKITVHELAWHFTRRIYKLEEPDTKLKEYTFKADEDTVFPDLLQEVLDSANLDMPIIKEKTISGLVSEWHFNENLKDNYGDNDGTWVGTESYSTGAKYPTLHNKGVNINSSRSVTLGSSDFNFDLSEPFSIVFNVSAMDLNKFGYILSKGTPTGNVFNIYKYGTNQIRVLFRTNVAKQWTPSYKIKINSYFELTLTYSGNNNLNGLKLYIDGKYIEGGTTSSLSGSINNNEPLTVGGYFQNIDFTLDNLAFYNKELTQDEITSIHGRNIIAEENSNKVQKIYRWDLGPDIPKTANFEFDLKWKSYHDVLKAMVLNSINDLWFEDRMVRVGKKGKTIAVDSRDKLYSKIKGKIDLKKYGNIVTVVGGKDENKNNLIKKVTNETSMTYNYDKVVADNKFNTQDGLNDVANKVINEIDSVNPDVEIEITKELLRQYELESGDVLKINAISFTQQIKGYYRIIKIVLSQENAKITLQFSKDGIFIPRISEYTDLFQGIFTRVKELEIDGGQK